MLGTFTITLGAFVISLGSVILGGFVDWIMLLIYTPNRRNGKTGELRYGNFREWSNRLAHIGTIT